MPKNLRLDGLRLVIDCANGAAYKVAPEALWELGAEIFPIGVEPNGRNINRACGSTEPEALVAKVREFGPMSASRSMAMPTGSSSSTRRAPSSTETSSWRHRRHVEPLR